MRTDSAIPLYEMRLPARIAIPVYLWVADYLAILAAIAAAVSWIYLNISELNVGNVIIFLLFIFFFGGAVESLLSHLKLSKLLIQEEGIVINAAKPVLVKWQNVVRCQPLKKRIILFYENAKKIEI